MGLNEISIVRGDTMRLVISEIKNSDGEEYILDGTDTVLLDVKKSVSDSKAVFSKKVTAADYDNGELPVVILPCDTAGLPAGDYFFDVRLKTDDENIYTIVPMSKLKILRNVTDTEGKV